MEKRTVNVGDVVIYTDHVRVEHKALVTAVWGDNHMGEDEGSPPSLNLVFVTRDEAKGDTYGRQIDRDTSVVHDDAQPAGANCWRLTG